MGLGDLSEQELAAVARADDQTRATMLEGVGGVQVYLGDGDYYGVDVRLWTR